MSYCYVTYCRCFRTSNFGVNVGLWNFGVGTLYKNLGRVGIWGYSPWMRTAHPQKCGVGLRCWENQRMAGKISAWLSTLQYILANYYIFMTHEQVMVICSIALCLSACLLCLGCSCWKHWPTVQTLFLTHGYIFVMSRSGRVSMLSRSRGSRGSRSGTKYTLAGDLPSTEKQSCLPYTCLIRMKEISMTIL